MKKVSERKKKKSRKSDHRLYVLETKIIRPEVELNWNREFTCPEVEPENLSFFIDLIECVRKDNLFVLGKGLRTIDIHLPDLDDCVEIEKNSFILTGHNRTLVKYKGQTHEYNLIQINLLNLSMVFGLDLDPLGDSEENHKKVFHFFYKEISANSKNLGIQLTRWATFFFKDFANFVFNAYFFGEMIEKGEDFFFKTMYDFLPKKTEENNH